VVFKNGKVDDVEIFSLAQLKGWSWEKNCKQRITISFSIDTFVLFSA